jgi:hypothetical protein
MNRKSFDRVPILREVAWAMRQKITKSPERARLHMQRSNRTHVFFLFIPLKMDHGREKYEPCPNQLSLYPRA